MAVDKDLILNVLRPVVGEAEPYEHHGQLSVHISRNEIIDSLRELRDNPLTAFDQCVDITAIDWLDKRKDRFEVVYLLYSIKNKSRVRLKVAVPEGDPQIPSATEIYESANWYERETYDMYGIHFEGHPDLRRFYMPEDYVDPESGEPLYPLRKDYPLMGVPGAAILPDFPEKESWMKAKQEYLKKYPSEPLKNSHSMN